VSKNKTFSITQKLPLITFLFFFCSVSTAAYLAAYIVDLILVLYEISMVVTVDPPKSLTKDMVMDSLATYMPRSPKIHDQVKKVAFTFKLEERIGTVIQDALPPLHR
jgi:hypothetical protein